MEFCWKGKGERVVVEVGSTMESEWRWVEEVAVSASQDLNQARVFAVSRLRVIGTKS